MLKYIGNYGWNVRTINVYISRDVKPTNDKQKDDFHTLTPYLIHCVYIPVMKSQSIAQSIMWPLQVKK